MQKYFKLIVVLLTVFGFASSANAQIVDEVISVIGEKIISRSELDFEISQAEAQFGTLSRGDKCEMMENLMIKKLMLNQAEIDSVSVSDDDVEAEIDNKVRYFASQVGSIEKFEDYLGKSVLEYKNEIRPKIKEQKLVKQLETNLFGEIKVSHREVKSYFDSIPKDSLPRIEAEYEVGQLVIKPNYSASAKYYAFRKAQLIRQRVINGEDFDLLARVYSDDPGSAKQGGLLPEFGRGEMVGEFEIEAYKLKSDSLSPVFESPYGYHVIKLVKRLGERVTAKHILIKPLLGPSEQQAILKKMDSIRQDLVMGKIGFCQAVTKYGNTDEYNVNCGMIADPYSGLLKVSIASLDPQTAKQVSQMKAGEFSQPAAFYLQDGTMGIRILYLKSETKAHIANMKEDYPRIQIAAQEAKKNAEIMEWVKRTRKITYTNINSNYLGCELEEWTNSSKKP